MTTEKEILVIGGAGFIGRHLVRALVGEGRSVTVLDQTAASPNLFPPVVDYVVGDFGCQELVVPLLDAHQDVIHLAYASVPGTSYADPLGDLLQNLVPAVQLFEALAARDRRLLLVSSGGTVYGETGGQPVSEEHPTKPISPYGVTKLTLESYAHLYAITHGLRFVCVRPANAYGPGQRPFTGQGFIATALASVMRGVPVKVFGFPGTVRDYLYIDDLIRGIVCALEKGRQGEIYNLGSGTGRSGLDVLQAMAPLFSKSLGKIALEQLPARPFDVQTIVLDYAKMREHTGWQPEAAFSDGLRHTSEWLRSYLDENCGSS